MDKANRVFGLATIAEEGGSLYQDLKNAGVELDNHESDLYALVTPESEKIIAKYPERRAKKFKSEKDGKVWFDIPFAYEPFWIEKIGRA